MALPACASGAEGGFERSPGNCRAAQGASRRAPGAAEGLRRRGEERNLPAARA